MPENGFDRDAMEGASLHAQLTASIREQIISGHLRDGEKIREGRLCDEFGVSRTPLREALKALAVEGLVELIPNRGAVVVPLNRDRLAEVFEAKGSLEHFIGLHAAQRITPEEMAHLESQHCALIDAAAREDAIAYTEVNQSVHIALAQSTKNPVVVEMYDRLTARILRARFVLNLDHGRMAQSLVEHESILAALRARARLDLAERLEQHNAATGAAILCALRK